MDDHPRYLIWSNQHGMWWRTARAGYTAFIEEAGRYTRDQAEAIVDGTTLNGQLWHIRRNPITGEPYRSFDEYIVPEPVPQPWKHAEIDTSEPPTFGEGWKSVNPQ